MKLFLVEHHLARMFTWLAHRTAERPYTFIAVPLVIAAVLSSGMMRISIINDIEYLFPPTNGRGYADQKLINALFPMNYSHDFEEGRILKMKGLVKVIITAKDGGNVLREEIFRDIETIDKKIRSIEVTNQNDSFIYKNLCARDLNRRCYSNDLMSLKPKLTGIRSGQIKIPYPLSVNNQTWNFEVFGNCLGAVELDDDDSVVSAKAAALVYHLDSLTPVVKDMTIEWEELILEYILATKFEFVDAVPFVSRSMEDEFGNDTLHSMHYFIITIFIMLTFSVVTSMMSDGIRSKPWLGILGCISSTISVGASMGLCVYCGMEFITINFVIPFIMLGIGLDDTFVLMSAWRRTKPSDPLKQRLAEANRHAGVSITITSLTNFTSFLVGSMTPFRAANILCSYMAVAVIFTYIYQITFFGGCMALLGRAECNNLHSIIFVPVLPKSLSKHKSIFYQLFLAGGIDPKNPKNPEDNKEHAVMIFFRDTFGNFLCRPSTKIGIIAVFLVYLAGAIYGTLHFKEGLEMYQIFSDDSYACDFAKKEKEYFYNYLFRVQIVIPDTLDYSKPEIQESITNMIYNLEQVEHIGDGYLTESWLHYYKMFLADPRSQMWTRNYNVSDKLGFINCLRDVFFKYPPARRFVKDVKFNDNFTEIVATRYVLQVTGLRDTVDGKNVVINTWKVLEAQPFEAFIYNPFFLIVTMFVMVMEFTIQAVGITSVIMMIITFCFIPSLTVCICVAFSIVVIELGVVGYMTLWGVHLNPTSLVCLIVCIGFSVDNSAHIAYAFVSTKATTGNGKMRNSLYYVGVPILQACGSTLIGVLVLHLTPSYNFHVFFKTITLVMIFAACQSLFLFPVLLSIFDDFFNKDYKPVAKEEELNALSDEPALVMNGCVKEDCEKPLTNRHENV